MIVISVLATGQIQVQTKLPEIVVAQILSSCVATMIARQAAALAVEQGPKVVPATTEEKLRIMRN